MLKVCNINAGYDGCKILFDVSLSAERGEKIAVIGPNGCGKTTLLRVIAGILPCTGEVTIDGISIRSLKRKNFAKRIAMLSQTNQIYFSYTVYDTVMMGRYPHSQNGLRLLSPFTKSDRQKVQDALESVGMADMKNRDIGTLSGGQLQRVFLAKIIAQDPDIVLLDEPTNHLDLRYQVELIDFLNDWSNKNGTTVIGVFHDINLAAQMADKALLMYNGRTVAFGPPRDVLTADVLNEIYKMDVNGFMIRSLRFWERN